MKLNKYESRIKKKAKQCEYRVQYMTVIEHSFLLKNCCCIFSETTESSGQLVTSATAVSSVGEFSGQLLNSSSTVPQASDQLVTSSSTVSQAAESSGHPVTSASYQPSELTLELFIGHPDRVSGGFGYRSFIQGTWV
jgi:hypothetical protein